MASRRYNDFLWPTIFGLSQPDARLQLTSFIMYVVCQDEEEKYAVVLLYYFQVWALYDLTLYAGWNEKVFLDNPKCPVSCLLLLTMIRSRKRKSLMGTHL